MLSLDKENTTGTGVSKSAMATSSSCSSMTASNAVSQSNQASTLVATPKNNANKLHMMTGNTTGKRRALGDVANTTNWQQAPSMMGITPKVERTVIGRQLCGEFNKPSSMIKKLTMPKLAVSNLEEKDLEPEER